MKKWMVAVALAAASSGGWADSIDKAVTSVQAAQEALSNRSLAETLWQDNIEACASRDQRALFEVMHRGNDQLHAQPTDYLKYRERFVYSGCKQMLLDVMFANGACLNRPISQHEANYINRRWQEDAVQCDAEIADPDLSLAELPEELTLEERIARWRAEGVPEEEITFRKKLHGL